MPPIEEITATPGGRSPLVSEADLEKIHAGTLEVLEEAGVVVMHAGGLDLLEAAGASVERETQIARIPAQVVEGCLAAAPSGFIMGSRDGAHDLRLGEGKLLSRNGGGPGHVQDLRSGQVRDALLSDVGDYARLVDGLPGMNICAPIYPQDVSPAVRDLAALLALFANTSKHINMRLLQVSSLPYVMEMAEIVGDSAEALRGRPPLTVLESPVAPLRIPDVLVETLLACGKRGIPVEICSMPIAGATGPVTLAGALLMSNVEMIASVVLSQLANPGAPLIFTPRIMIMDLRSGYAMTGSVENALLAAAGAQLARRKYNLPVNVHGPYTDCVTSDAQAGIENAYFTLLPALAGADILTGAGHLEGGLFVSYTQLMIDSEIIAVVRRLLEGLIVDDVSLGVDAVCRSLHSANLLTDPHTIANMRKIRHDQPTLIRRLSRQAWEKQGGFTMKDRAADMAARLLASHQPAPLGAPVLKELNRVYAAAQKAAGL